MLLPLTVGVQYSTEKQLPPIFFDTLLAHKMAAAQANASIGMLTKVAARHIAWGADSLRQINHDEHLPSIWQSGCGLDFNRWANNRIVAACAEAPGPSITPDLVNLNQSTNDLIPTVIQAGLLRIYTQGLRPVWERLAERLRTKAKIVDGHRVMGRTFLRDAKWMPLSDVIESWAELLGAHGEWLNDAADKLTLLPQGGYSLGNGDGVDRAFATSYVRRLSSILDTDYQRSSSPSVEISGIRTLSAFAGALTGFCAGIEKIAGDAMLLCSGPEHGFGDLRFAESANDSTTLQGKSNPKKATMTLMICNYCRSMCNLVVDLTGRGQLALFTHFPLTAYALFDAVAVLSQYVPVFTAFIDSLTPTEQ